MSSNSSTSSSEVPSAGERDLVTLGPLERMSASSARPWPRPWAAVVFLLVVGIIETALHVNRVWFADRAAWQWDTKKQMLAQGQLQGDIAVLGTSVLFHGVDAAKVNQQLDGQGPVVMNLALNGMQIHQITQMVIREHERGHVYRHLLLELRDLELDRNNWVGGPYWRLWADFDEVKQSRAFLYEPDLLMSFLGNRLLTSYNYRQGLDNWLFASARHRGPVATYRDRNLMVSGFMASHAGYSELEVTTPMREADVPAPRDRPWSPNDAGLWWMEKLVAYCQQHDIALTLFDVPAPPCVRADRDRFQYTAAVDAYVASLRMKYPQAKLGLLRLDEPFGLEDFTDDVHYSPAGVRKMTQAVATWAKDLP